MASLENRGYFPAFCELPLMDEYCDASYYTEVPGGVVLPNKTWCFFAEIADASLSQMPEFFHRCEVRDIMGETSSVLFGTDNGSLDFTELRHGSTLFVRYAAKCYFSDLMTQVLKVDDLDYAKVIAAPLDVLLSYSAYYFGSGAAAGRCLACGAAASGAHACGGCGVACYCSARCEAQHAPQHKQHCGLCRELADVLLVDFDRFVGPVPFRRSC